MSGSVLLQTFLQPADAVKRVLNPDLHVNLGEVKSFNSKPPGKPAVVLQIRRLTDAEAIHLHLPIAIFHGASSFEDVLRHDPGTMAKLILFLA